MATNLTNNQTGQLDNEVQTVPLSATGTGTVSTQGIAIIGSGTAFKTELRTGSYLFNGSDEIRRVRYVETDTLAYLEDAFTADLSSDALLFVDSKKAQTKSISALMPLGESGATVNGTDMIEGVPVTFEKTGNSHYGRVDFVNPIIVDATSSVVTYSIQY